MIKSSNEPNTLTSSSKEASTLITEELFELKVSNT